MLGIGHIIHIIIVFINNVSRISSAETIDPIASLSEETIASSSESTANAVYFDPSSPSGKSICFRAGRVGREMQSECNIRWKRFSR